MFVCSFYTKTIMEAPTFWLKFQTNPFVADTALLLGLAWLGLVWLGLAWFGLAWLYIKDFKPCKLVKNVIPSWRNIEVVLIVFFARMYPKLSLLTELDNTAFSGSSSPTGECSSIVITSMPESLFPNGLFSIFLCMPVVLVRQGKYKHSN